MKKVLFHVLLLIMALLCGCTAGETPKGVNKAALRSAPEYGDSNRAAAIASVAAKVEGVRKAAVVITGATVIIGVIPESAQSDAELIALKKAVERAVKGFDNTIEHAAVTSSEELFERIAAMKDSGVSDGSYSH